MPAGVVALAANSQAAAAIFGPSENQGLNAYDNNTASTNAPTPNGPGTHSAGSKTNSNQIIEVIDGVRH